MTGLNTGLPTRKNPTKGTAAVEIKPVRPMGSLRAVSMEEFMQQRYLVIDRRNNRAERYKLCDILMKFG